MDGPALIAFLSVPDSLPRAVLGHSRGGALAILATLLGIYIIDCLMNAFPNLVYGVTTGGLIAAMPSGGRYARGAEDLQRGDRLTPRGRLRSGDDGAGKLAARPDGVADTPDGLRRGHPRNAWPDVTCNWRER